MKLLCITSALVLATVTSEPFGTKEGSIKTLHDDHPAIKSLLTDEAIDEMQTIESDLAKQKKRLENLEKAMEALQGGSHNAVKASFSRGKNSESVQQKDYSKIRDEIDLQIQALEQYYENDPHILADAPLKKPGQGDEKLVARMVLKMLDTQETKQFKIATAGSSVTAGHDGWYNTSWPLVLERRLAPVWEMFGVRLIVFNAAVGGRNPNPYSLCLSPMLGDDTDVVMREWEFWPWSAGFNEDMVTKKGQSFEEASIEIFLRNAFFMSNQPAVHIIKMAYDGGLERNDYLKLAETRGRFLSGYREGFVINGFDNFGKPFEHLRDKAAPFKERWVKDEKGKEHCSQDNRRNVADCPVDYDKQDGYHSHAQDLGYDVAAHPRLKKYDNHNLFVNWHPAPLGHEVIGNQVAYYHLQLMRRAVSYLLNPEGISDVVAQLEAVASRSNMPPNIACSDVVCGTRSHCAYSYLPKAQGPDVGDWMQNESETKGSWTNEIAPGQYTCDPAGKLECEEEREWDQSDQNVIDCHERLRRCSYIDQKRGFKGTAESRPMRLRFTNLWHCQVFIGEPNYEWDKPYMLANWQKEMKISINGEPCSKEDCQFYRDSYLNSAMINVRKAIGGKCRREPVTIEITLEPLTPEQLDELHVCEKESDDCRPGELFSDYAGRLCQNGDGEPWANGECRANPTRNKEKVFTFISQVIAF